jgi:hypothetical protein
LEKTSWRWECVEEDAVQFRKLRARKGMETRCNLGLDPNDLLPSIRPHLLIF